MDNFFAWLSVVFLIMTTCVLVLTLLDMAYYYLWLRPYFKELTHSIDKSLQECLKLVESLPVIEEV